MKPDMSSEARARGALVEHLLAIWNGEAPECEADPSDTFGPVYEAILQHEMPLHARVKDLEEALARARTDIAILWPALTAAIYRMSLDADALGRRAGTTRELEAARAALAAAKAKKEESGG